MVFPPGYGLAGIRRRIMLTVNAEIPISQNRVVKNRLSRAAVARYSVVLMLGYLG